MSDEIPNVMYDSDLSLRDLDPDLCVDDLFYMDPEIW